MFKRCCVLFIPDANMNTGGQTVPIVCCVDRGALVGLHVTVRTALLYLREGRVLEINVLHDRVTTREFDNLRRTLDMCGKPYKLQTLEVDPSRFKRMKWLGGWMTYVRLVVPDVLAHKKIVYLDADLIIYADLAELFNYDLNDSMIGAATWESIETSNDSKFFRSLGRDKCAPYYNCGVMLFNSEKWRNSDMTSRCLHVGDQYSTSLPSADQTIINLQLQADISPIPRKFNTPVTASRPLLAEHERIGRVIHLVARPKPWDPMGFLNGQSALFRGELAKTALAGARPDYWSLATWKRTARLAKAYCKCIATRVRT